jgi:hypothetical protein
LRGNLCQADGGFKVTASILGLTSGRTAALFRAFDAKGKRLPGRGFSGLTTRKTAATGGSSIFM